MNTFEQALKKLDSIEQNLNNQAEEINQKDQQITKKDNKIFQLIKLIEGQEKIYRKQYTSIYELQEKLKEEQKEKGISQEKAQHLEEDIKRLDNEKAELNKRIKELNNTSEESKKARDKELEDLKKKVRELTEVKMARVQSEERLKKQSEEFEKVMKINEQVYDVLGKFSSAVGLLPRATEIVVSLTKAVNATDGFQLLNEEDLKKRMEIVTYSGTFNAILHIAFFTLSEYRKEKFWWDKWINDDKCKSRTHYSPQSPHETEKRKIPNERVVFLFNYLKKIDNLDRYFYSIDLKESEGKSELLEQFDISEKGKVRLTTFNCKYIIKALYQYYRDK